MLSVSDITAKDLKEVQDYIDEHLATTELEGEDALLFAQLVMCHVEIGSMPEDPPEIIGIKDEVLREFLDFTWFVFKESRDKLLKSGLINQDQPEHVTFETGYTMGMAMGAVLERKKHG